MVDGQHEVVAVEPLALEAAGDVLAPPVSVVAVAPQHRGGARVHPVAELLGEVPAESTTTRSPSPASSNASRSRNSPIGERQMFPQHTTTTR